MAPKMHLGPYAHVDPVETDVVAAAVFSGLVCTTVLGAGLDVWLKRRRQRGQDEKQRLEHVATSYWSTFLMVASYIVLIPGYVCLLFDTRVSIFVFNIEKVLNGNSESSVSLIRDLVSQGVPVAACFVAFYAMVVPAIKIVLLVVGWYLQRFGTAGESSTLWARRCIVFVQAISKWACPDMFAYILMMCLFRFLDAPPSLRSNMTLGPGFACFSLFCIGSTVACLGLHPPAAPEASCEENARFRLTRYCGVRTLSFVAMGLAAAFVPLFVLGISRNCMELTFEIDKLYASNPLLKGMSSLMEAMHLGDLLHAEVSVLQSLQNLAGWSLHGELTSVIAAIMYGMFVIVLPVLDMFLMLILAVLLARGRFSRENPGHSAVVALSRVFRKLAMLDVSIMGTFVVVLALQNWAKDGIILSAGSGAFFLLVAELCHGLVSQVIEGALDVCQARERSVSKSDFAAAEDGTVSVTSTESGQSETAASQP